MKFFLDTAQYEAIIAAQETGLLAGVTTNPTHLSKESGDLRELILKIAHLVAPGDVSVEITEHEPRAIYTQAHAIAALAPNIVVKIPCYQPYLPLIKQLVHEGVPINVTLLFSAVQGLCMAQLSVKYISPFVGRLDDIDTHGIDLIKDLRTIFDRFNYKTQILAASLRTVSHIHEAALAGADCATIPVNLFESMLNHPLTDRGMALFDRNWKTVGIKKFP
jgi:transaldolase